MPGVIRLNFSDGVSSTLTWEAMAHWPHGLRVLHWEHKITESNLIFIEQVRFLHSQLTLAMNVGELCKTT